jgi:predicted DCC family thiol-disulfide oxidoreductase YuxK
VLKHDRRGIVQFAPLQGSTFAASPAKSLTVQADSVLLVDASGVHTHSNAVVQLCSHIGGLYGAIAALGRLIPRPIRDAMYRFVARNRIAWFGTADACQLPSASHRERFLP